MLNKVTEIMITPSNFPIVKSNASLKNALDEMTKYGLGIACVVDSEHQLVGLLTDGDLRRLLLTRQNPLPALLISNVIEFCGPNPYTIGVTSSTSECIEIMKARKVSDLPVTESNGRLVGLVHLHAII
jgi:CBS domain-containing protein